jgi:hypothetical protein
VLTVTPSGITASSNAAAAGLEAVVGRLPAGAASPGQGREEGELSGTTVLADEHQQGGVGGGGGVRAGASPMRLVSEVPQEPVTPELLAESHHYFKYAVRGRCGKGRQQATLSFTTRIWCFSINCSLPIICVILVMRRACFPQDLLRG